MILDYIIPEVALSGTRRERVKSALGSFSLTGIMMWGTNDLFQPGRSIGENILGIGMAGAMCVSTFNGTYSLMSAMETDTPQTS
jgi:hypothetical protein